MNVRSKRLRAVMYSLPQTMIMRNLTLICTSAVCFLLGTLVPFRSTHAQTQGSKPGFYNISFMKTRPGYDAMAAENQWKSVHMDLVKSGVIKSWSVLKPVYMGPHDYDYMTLVEFDNRDAYQKVDFHSLFTKNGGEDKWRSVLDQTHASHDEIGNEIWSVVMGTGY